MIPLLNSEIPVRVYVVVVRVSLGAYWAFYRILCCGQSQVPLRRLLHATNVIRTAITHFVSTLTSYVMFEVVEISWGELVKGVKAAQGLSDLIAAHDDYLSTILQKVCVCA